MKIFKPKQKTAETPKKQVKNPFGIKTSVYRGLWGLAAFMFVGIATAQFTVTSSGGSGVYTTNSLGTLYFYSGSTTGYLFPNGTSLEEYYFWTRRPTAASSFSATRCSSYNRQYNTFGTTGFTNGDDCRNNYLGGWQYYCSSGNRWRRQRWEGVCNTASGYCSDSNSYQGGYSNAALYQNCSNGCSSGSCISSSSSSGGCTHGQEACVSASGSWGTCSNVWCLIQCNGGTWNMDGAQCTPNTCSDCAMW